MAHRKLTVLFLCTGNSARSQIAEGLLRKLAGDRFEVHSAGTEPKPVHPLTIRVLEEVGVDARQHRSKDVREFLGKARIDYAIIVCERARQSCPSVYPFAYQTLFWPFDDPASHEGSDEEHLAEFRRVREDIVRQIEDWVDAQGTERET